MRSFFILATCASVIFGGLTLILPRPAFADDPSFATDDAFLMIGGTSLNISESTLRLNDSVPPWADLSIASQPEHGDLAIQWIENKQILTYTPDVNFHGPDGLTYDVGGLGARVLLYVSPPKSPIIGRWPTPSCHPPDAEPNPCEVSLELGQGVEIGWYDAAGEFFRLCDWQGETAKDCVNLFLPQSDPVAARGWIPLALDVDADGWDELALRHPLTGETRIYAILLDPVHNNPAGLSEIDSFWFGAAGDLPLAGQWEPASGRSQLGLYAFDHHAQPPVGELVIDVWNDANSALGDPLTAPFQRPWPLAGDWLGSGTDQVGAYELDGSRLWFVDLETEAAYDLDVQSCGGPIEALAVAGRISNGATEGFLGLIQHDLKKLYLIEDLTECGEVPVRPLPREVAIDPSTR